VKGFACAACVAFRKIAERKPSQNGTETFSKWYRDLFAKHQDEKDKGFILAAAIDKSFMFDDAKVPLYPSIVKMILKRDWTASDVVK